MTTKSTEENKNNPAATVPIAEVRTQQPGKGSLKTRLWWLTGPLVVLSLGLIVASLYREGTMINVRFLDGHGLKVGDSLRYRGIDIGRVTNVGLAADYQAIDVQIQLLPGNEGMAVEDTQFWIQRARVSLGQVSGLETVLGAKYVGILPGRSHERKNSFVGIENPLSTHEADYHECVIYFDSSDGLSVGNHVRYRGLTIGEVTLVELDAQHNGVQVTVHLTNTARSMAREGTQFWIEQPRLELTEIRGLQTLVGGSYIAMEPGPSDAAVSSEFFGLNHPPPLPRKEGSLEIQLDAPQRWGIVRGAPISYRGMEVGSVAHIGLSSDGATVRITAVIDSDYVELVRDNSQWWAVSGVRWKFGLTGVELSVDSMSAWLRGGIGFATPASPGKNVVSGHRFTLNERAREEWLDWQPKIAVAGRSRIGAGLELPTPLRLVASWNTSILGISRRRTEKSWSLALDDGTLLLPRQLAENAANAGSNVTLETEGKSIPFRTDKVQFIGALARHPLPADFEGQRWKVQPPPSDLQPGPILLVINPELSEPLAIDRSRLESLPEIGWKISSNIAIPAQLDGSAVIDPATGQLAGLVCKTKTGWVLSNIRNE